MSFMSDRLMFLLAVLARALLSCWDLGVLLLSKQSSLEEIEVSSINIFMRLRSIMKLKMNMRVHAQKL